MRALSFCIAVAVAPLAYGQGKAAPAKADATAKANPISSVLGYGYDRVKKFLIGSAELMPADQYNYKPTPDVRSFGQLIGHVADSQWMFCGFADKKPPAKKASAEKLATKAELQKALNEAFAYCDKVYADSTDSALATEMIQMFGMKLPKYAALATNVAHDNEHYGNIVTYLRMKKLTPPSSAGDK